MYDSIVTHKYYVILYMICEDFSEGVQARCWLGVGWCGASWRGEAARTVDHGGKVAGA